jgi:hypothetical protein
MGLSYEADIGRQDRHAKDQRGDGEHPTHNPEVPCAVT